MMDKMSNLNREEERARDTLANFSESLGQAKLGHAQTSQEDIPKKDLTQQHISDLQAHQISIELRS